MHLKIIPLGGLGEIGLNMMIFEYGTTLFIVDAGLMFPEDYMLGVDFVIPDMDYVKKKPLSDIRYCPDPRPRRPHRGLAVSAERGQRPGLRHTLYTRSR